MGRLQGSLVQEAAAPQEGETVQLCAERRTKVRSCASRSSRCTEKRDHRLMEEEPVRIFRFR